MLITAYECTKVLIIDATKDLFQKHLKFGLADFIYSLQKEKNSCLQ